VGGNHGGQDLHFEEDVTTARVLLRVLQRVEHDRREVEFWDCLIFSGRAHHKRGPKHGVPATGLGRVFTTHSTSLALTKEEVNQGKISEGK
jgi:hypothetical protein